MSTFPLVFIDRSRIQAYLDCRRLRYLRYHYPIDGVRKGLQPKQKSLPLVSGSFIHKAIELHLTGMPLDDAIAYARGAFVEEAGLPPEQLREQLFLLECLVRAWVAFRLPQILDEYEVVSVEEELRWPLDSQIIDMVKCDVILRRKADGLLFILEFKTLKRNSRGWREQWLHNTQVLANIMAIQEVLGEPVAGMLIEGLVKGSYEKDTGKTSPFFGQPIQHSPFCYAYKQEVDGEVVFSLDWGRGKTKFRVWEEFTPEEWVATFSAQEFEGLFVPVPPIKPRVIDLVRWKRQTLHQEHQIVVDLKRLDRARLAEDDELEEILLDQLFPKNDSHCFRYFGYPCPFEPLCFNGEVEQAPLESGLYEARVPHHKEGPEENAA